MEEPRKRRDLPQNFDQSSTSKCYYNQLAQTVCDRLIANGKDIYTYDGLIDAAREIESTDN